MVSYWFLPYAIACGNTFILETVRARAPLDAPRFRASRKNRLANGSRDLSSGGKDVSNALCDHPRKFAR